MLSFLKAIGDIFAFVVLAICSYLCGDCDFWTRFLKEDRNYWKGRVCWITGASDGIGKELALQLALREGLLILSSRHSDKLEQTRQDILAACKEKGLKTDGKDILVLQCDVGDSAAIDKAVETAISWKGNISFLFNNAGVSNRGCFLDADIEKKLLDVDLLGPMRLTNRVMSMMKKNGFGHIIFTNSLSGRIWSAGRTSYCTAKAGLLAYASALERECKGKSIDIAFSSILLGYVDTDISSRAFGPFGTPNKSSVSVSSPTHKKGLTTERSVQLMLRGASNRLSECWISKQPYLFFLYVTYYLPFFGSHVLNFLAKSHCDKSDDDANMHKHETT